MSNVNNKKTCKNIFITFLCCFIGIFSAIVPTVQAKTKAKLNHSKVTILTNETLKLELTGNTEKVKWSSSNTKVAKVSKNGKVTAKFTGTAIITAKVDHKEYFCKVKVETPKMYGKSLILMRNIKCLLRVSNTTLPVEWQSKDADIVKVNSKGVATAVATGETTITAKIRQKIFKIKITVIDSNGSEEVIVLE